MIKREYVDFIKLIDKNKNAKVYTLIDDILFACRDYKSTVDVKILKEYNKLTELLEANANKKIAEIASDILEIAL